MISRHTKVVESRTQKYDYVAHYLCQYRILRRRILLSMNSRISGGVFEDTAADTKKINPAASQNQLRQRFLALTG
jgi:hypothetical protein